MATGNASYDYMAHPTRTFERESFSPLAMANLDVNGMAYVGRDGRVVIARWIEGELADRPTARAAMGRGDRAAGTSMPCCDGGSSTSFYARFGDRLVAVGIARKVRRSDGTGAPRGVVLMARAISPQQLSDLLAADRADRSGRACQGWWNRRSRA